MTITPPPIETFYCDHCVHLATTEVTWREHESTEPEPFTEHSILVCGLHADTAIRDARRDGDDNPTVTRFEQGEALDAAA